PPNALPVLPQRPEGDNPGMFASVCLPALPNIFTIPLIIFCPPKLPEPGKSLRERTLEIKHALHELKNTLDEEIRLEDQRSTQRAPDPHTVRTPSQSEPASDNQHPGEPRQNGSA